MRANINKKDKSKIDKIWNWVTFSFSVFLMIIFISIFVFIVISAVPGLEEYGAKNILGTTEFSLADGKAGIWTPIAITLLITFGAVLIATPIGIKTAIFIKFRLNKKYQKTASIIAQSLSGIPSVIFGLFAINSLGKLVSLVFGVNGSYNMINAIIMLSFMILPTIISLTLNTFNSISDTQLLNPISLGLNKTYAIYKVFKKKAKNGIVIAVIIAIGRAFGETMALSMILTSESYSIISQGVAETLTSSLGTLGTIIATNMFSESGGEGLRGILYTFGIILFIFVLVLNGIILFATRNKKNKANKFLLIENKIANFILWVPNTISNFFTNLYINKKDNPNINHRASISKYVKLRFESYKLANFRTWIWLTTEILATLITFSFLAWICGDIIVGGFSVLYNSDLISNGEYVSTAFKYGLDTTGQAFINTLIIVFVSLLISIPIALFIAIYLNEYAKKSKVKKIVLFFVDCLGSSPSIIFGMFGLAIFIELMGLSVNGSMGRSLIAGCLTISIVILPSLIRTMQQALEGVSLAIRLNAYSLGCNKWETIWKVVIKHAYKSMMSSIVLAVGRIMAETAPLYLTAGLTSVSGIGLMLPGQTLTTRIYSQLAGEKTLSASNAIQYECAFIALLIVFALIWIGNYIIPNSFIIKRHFINCYRIIDNFFNFAKKKNLEKLKKQIINKSLFVTFEQAEQHQINPKQVKLFYYDKKIYSIKYLSNEKMNELANSLFVKKYNY